MPPKVAAINLSNGGVPKRPVPEALLTGDGFAGDRQLDRRHHGGPDRAASLYSLELIEALALEGHPVSPGSLGENVTISGLDWSAMRPGLRLHIGEAEIELTAFAAPCKTIRGAFLDEQFTRISHKVHPGWSRLYARVLRDGMIRVGDAVTPRSKG
jgi:MOSC domain-containing protein YiiM